MRPDVYIPHSNRASSEEGSWSDGRSKLFRLLGLLAMVVGLGAAGWKVVGPADGNWLSDLDEGLAVAAATEKPVLVLYTADWSPSCRQLERRVLSDRRIAAFLQREFVLVRVDLSNRLGPGNQLAARAKVVGVPALIVRDPEGKEVKRLSGEAIGTWIRRKAELDHKKPAA